MGLFKGIVSIRDFPRIGGWELGLGADSGLECKFLTTK